MQEHKAEGHLQQAALHKLQSFCPYQTAFIKFTYNYMPLKVTYRDGKIFTRLHFTALIMIVFEHSFGAFFIVHCRKKYFTKSVRDRLEVRVE